MVSLAAFQAQLAQNQLEVDDTEHELRDAHARYDRNRLEVARLQSPERILAEAERMGMQPARASQYLTPSVAVVAEVLRASGTGPVDRSTGATRPDWSEYKKATA
jgi:hypothetical protein